MAKLHHPACMKTRDHVKDGAFRVDIVSDPGKMSNVSNKDGFRVKYKSDARESCERGIDKQYVQVDFTIDARDGSP